MKKIIIFVGIIITSLSLMSCNFQTNSSSSGALSAYEIAVKNGFTGTEEEWLESLKGQDGASLHITDIYNKWLADGNTGTFEQFITKYFSDTYFQGKSAYELAVEAGFEGTEEEWLASLKGDMGMTGAAGDTVDLYEVYLTLRDVTHDIDCTYLEFIQQYLNVNFDNSNTAVIAKALTSVVTIAATNYTPYDSNGNLNENLKYAAGSGVIYQLNNEGDAYIITNYHVVYDSDVKNAVYQNIFVNVYGNQELINAIPAKFVGGSATYDIAVLFIDGDTGALRANFNRTSPYSKPGYKAKVIFEENGITAITVADSNNVTPGMTAIAIGNPQGDGVAVTEGIISVDSETIYMDPIIKSENSESVAMRVMRVDTAVNPGNSGGGLFDEKGRLIGIVNAKSIEEIVDNVGYAIPSNIAIYVANNVIRNSKTGGNVTKALIGIQVSYENSYALYDPVSGTTRIYEDVVVEVVDTTSVLYGKLKEGDVIKTLTFDDTTYVATRSFIIIDACLNASVGTKAELVVLRDGKEVNINFTFKDSNVIQ